MNKGLWMTLIGIGVAVVGAFAAIALISRHKGCDCDEYDYDDMMDDDLDCDYCKPVETEQDACEAEKAVEAATDAESTDPVADPAQEEGFDIEDDETDEK